MHRLIVAFEYTTSSREMKHANNVGQESKSNDKDFQSVDMQTSAGQADTSAASCEKYCRYAHERGLSIALEDGLSLEDATIGIPHVKASNF